MARQDALQVEASVVHDDLGLGRLARWGEPVRVGSAALGLMVRRDLDVTVVCARLDAATAEGVAVLGAEMFRHPRVRSVQLRDDTERWNTDPAYPDGIYLGLRYRTVDQHDWSLDVWFIDEPDRQPDLAHLRTIPPRLTEETRRAILTIKQASVDTPSPGPTVSGHEVSTAVLDDGVRTPAEFWSWRAARA